MAGLSSFVPKSLLPATIATRKLVQAFAERSGMVYFGYVSQRSDEHHIVRGLTVSNKHADDHYCIGTFDNYDVVFVERTDSLHSGKRHVWHILEVDLKTTKELPHIFIGSTKHGHGFHELLRTKYPHLTAAVMGTTAKYPDVFVKQFSVYTKAADSIEAEKLLHPEISAIIGAHFKGLVLEITEQSLFIYSERSHVTAELLDTMLRNGVWLAEQIDTNSRQM